MFNGYANHFTESGGGCLFLTLTPTLGTSTCLKEFKTTLEMMLIYSHYFKELETTQGAIEFNAIDVEKTVVVLHQLLTLSL